MTTTIPRRNNTIPCVAILISLCLIIAFVTITHQSTLQENSDVSARRTITTDTLMKSSQQEEQPRKHTMVGGYSNLGHDNKTLLKSEEVVKVANFALKEYAAKTASETTETSSSSELQHDSLTVTPEEVESGKVTAVVLEAHRQVVAGLNYKLTIALMKEEEDSNNNIIICLGAIKVTVYDHFGELQVTKWGDKLMPCNEEVQDLLEEVKQQTEVEEQEQEEEKALEVEGEIEDGMEEVEPNERR